MSNSNPAANKTETSAKSRLKHVWLGSWLMVCWLSTSIQGVATQQTQPIKPCVVEAPCLPTSTSTGNAGTKRASSHKRASTRKQGSATAPAKVAGRVREILVDSSIPDDPAVEKLLAPYSAKVRALDVVIGKLDLELKKGPVGGGNLGSFAADGMRAQSSVKLGKPVLLAFTNTTGLRKNGIAAGDMRAADIFELLPFENALVELDLTGEQLLRLLTIIVASGDALTGARVTYRMNAENRPELVSARLLDGESREMAIDPQGTYSIVTIDYLVKLGSGRYSLLQEGKNVRPLGLTIRDAVMDYVKAETASGRSIKGAQDDRFVLIGSDAPKPGSQQR
jgi:2',3'-cyclic-nucleotide 2'-phosphodiesterase (5'-nucleotidase family)